VTSWTTPARDFLEERLRAHRRRFEADGAEADEVMSDLREHVMQEAAAQGLTVVTEVDVRRLLARVDPMLLEEPTGGESGDGTGAIADPAPPTFPGVPSDPPRSGFQRTSVEILLGLFGVLLPLGTIGLEWTQRLSALELTDPIPTPFHGILLLLVPAVYALGLWFRFRRPGSAPGFYPWLLAVALGVSGAYAAAFAPAYPVALVGVLYFGLGLIPLTPLLAWIVGWILWRRARIEARENGHPWPRWAWVLSWGVVAALGLAALPGFLTEELIRTAVHGDSQGERFQAIQRLRSWGDSDVLLRACYGRRVSIWDNLLDRRPAAAEAVQQVYFQVTGQPFNAVRPPLNQQWGVGRQVLSDFEWDRSLGGETVAGQVSGLSLRSSRLDGQVSVPDGWEYVEWTLEFQNDNDSRQREARAEIQLPPGGVVSRVTLWVHDEEREAAFAGRGETRAAYQQVAVAQRRDPILVTTSGPDRVLMQCFPIEPRGGTMKVRLGITAPLLPVGTGELECTWPRFTERNFRIDPALEHHLWLEGGQAPARVPSGAFAEASKPEVLRSRLKQSLVSDGFDPIAFAVDPAPRPSAWAVDDRSTPTGWVRQTLVDRPPLAPGRLAIVVDGGVDGREAWEAIRKGLGASTARGDLRVYVASDGVHRVAEVLEGPYRAATNPMDRFVWNSPPFVGGQDPIPALEEAWTWVTGSQDGRVLWIHGPVPVLLGDTASWLQSMDRLGDRRASLIDFGLRPGPNLVTKGLGSRPALQVWPRIGGLEADLARCLDRMGGVQGGREWRRERVGTAPDVEARGSRHLVRLWARDHILDLAGQRRVADAVEWAGRWQLVTPVSGAVVLETRAQYAAAGLKPVDPLTTPQVVPEPQTWMLMALGLGLLAVIGRHRGRNGAGGSV